MISSTYIWKGMHILNNTKNIKLKVHFLQHSKFMEGDFQICAEESAAQSLYNRKILQTQCLLYFVAEKQIPSYPLQ